MKLKIQTNINYRSTEVLTILKKPKIIILIKSDNSKTTQLKKLRFRIRNIQSFIVYRTKRYLFKILILGNFKLKSKLNKIQIQKLKLKIIKIKFNKK